MRRKRPGPPVPSIAYRHPDATGYDRKLSDVMKKMAMTLLLDPDGVPSAEAAHLALFLANIAWNECVGLVHDRDESRAVWGELEASNPDLWSELKSRDIEGMIDELVEHKKRHYPDDRRRVLVCGMLNGKVRVEWLAPAAEDVDSQWEMQLFGLVRIGALEAAVRFLRDTKGLSRREATRQVAELTTRFNVN